MAGRRHLLRDPRTPARAAAAALAIQVLALIAFCVYYAVRLARHEGANSARVLMSIVLLALVAVLLALLARAMAAGRAWSRTPTLVWQALLLPVALGMFQSDRPDLGGAVLALALVGIVGAVLAGSHDTDESADAARLSSVD